MFDLRFHSRSKKRLAPRREAQHATGQTIYPTATASLTPGAYSHALWQNAGSISAFCWASGSLMINGAAQP